MKIKNFIERCRFRPMTSRLINECNVQLTCREISFCMPSSIPCLQSKSLIPSKMGNSSCRWDTGTSTRQRYTVPKQRLVERFEKRLKKAWSGGRMSSSRPSCGAATITIQFLRSRCLSGKKIENPNFILRFTDGLIYSLSSEWTNFASGYGNRTIADFFNQRQ